MIIKFESIELGQSDLRTGLSKSREHEIASGENAYMPRSA